MTKLEFLGELRKELSGLPQSDIEERLSFYGEMIDDRIEEGILETQAVEEIGSVEEIASQVVSDTPLLKIAKEKIKPKKPLKAWEITALILGSPVWLSLGLSVVAVILSLYVSLWAVIVSLWSVFASFVATSFGGVLAFNIFIASGNIASGIVMLAACMVLAGLSIFAFYGCKAATKGTLILTEKIAIWIKNCFKGRG